MERLSLLIAVDSYHINPAPDEPNRRYLRFVNEVGVPSVVESQPSIGWITMRFGKEKFLICSADFSESKDFAKCIFNFKDDIFSCRSCSDLNRKISCTIDLYLSLEIFKPLTKNEKKYNFELDHSFIVMAIQKKAMQRNKSIQQEFVIVLNRQKIPRIKIFGIITLCLNSTSIVFALIYLILQNSAFVWNLVGILYIVNLFITMAFTLCLRHNSQKSSKLGYRLNLWCFGYLFFVIFAVSFIFLAIFIGFNDNFFGNLGLGILLYGCNFGLLLYGIRLSLYSILPKYQQVISSSTIDQQSGWKLSTKSFRKLQILKHASIIISLLGLVFGGLVAFSILFGIRGGFQTFMVGVFAGQAGIFFGIGFLGTSLIFLRVTRSFQQIKILSGVICLIGILISGICFLPLLSTPRFAQNAENAFSERFNPVFSSDWNSEILKSGQNDYFLQTPFSLAGYFLGSPNYDCIVNRDVLYLDGISSNYSVDTGVQLYFDAYLPSEPADNLPGNNSTLIRIHGGGWTIGDKGLGNVVTMNRYFAAQGYCVFDIQYGLNNGPENMGIPFITPSNVLGNFSLDDMMRHIGAFTFFLEEHQDDYGANLDSVFISGGSAGGQLACATALSIQNGSYGDTFSDAFTIKGLIPYYPANNITMSFAHESKPEWKNPELLVSNQSPACLIFQGDQDHLITRAKSFENTYLEQNNREISVLIFPFAGHANDLYFPGYYNQVFLYYMERFMYLYH